PDGLARIIFYVPIGDAGEKQLSRVGDAFANLRRALPEVFVCPIALRKETVDDSAWLDEWKKYYKPLRIGEKIVVCPLGEKYEANAFEIVCMIDPGSVFGTGQHESTQLCAEALERLAQPGDAVLDAGCGSGILFILALLLGAGRTVACDIDPAAIVNSKINAALNNLDEKKYSLHEGDVVNDARLKEIIGGEKFNLVVANIVADPIIKLAPFANKILAAGGTFVASGIISERRAEVWEAFINAGFINIQGEERGEWHAVFGTKRG
ncbi:MAG: 50S ribosomal protein L11 methyltransferase, partial [Defluviitaleaceae bacterium]|nr:50S ribosomal protein L11 methyltransferase [Defluviitaleaceae bacterium]